MKAETYSTEYSWSQGSTETLAQLNTSIEVGLSEIEASQRLEIVGTNSFQSFEKKTAVSIFLRQFESPLVFILIVAAIITTILHEWSESVVILLAVFINTGLGFNQEYHAENTIEKLATFIKDRSRVIRDGREQEIDAETLVPGDILKLSYGSRVPADVRLLVVNNLRIDEAVLTGESIPVQKQIESVNESSSIAERKSMAFAGTLVVDGFGTAVVVATGSATEIGKIAKLVSSTERALTPIQLGVNKLAWIIFGVVLVIVTCIFLLGVSRGESILEMLVLSVAIAVGAVPEALPIALTVILAIGTERIAKKRGIVRTLTAAETLGSATLIMTDKTGTLTEANMKLIGIHSKDALTSGYATSRESHSRDHTLLEMALNNVDVLIENPLDESKSWNIKGKPFEVNIVKTARERGLDISRFAATQHSSIVVPFNSTYKFSVSSVGTKQIIMGAPDILLQHAMIDVDSKNAIEDWITLASTDGLRLIALGTSSENIQHASDIKNITFEGVLAFHDPVRKEVPEAIEHIESLGIRIVMITGDLKGTAMALAKEIGWNITDEQVLTGHDLQTMSDEELSILLPTIKIFARVTPEDKLRVGMLYRSLGEVVAMTGDGVNDSPALKAMDIGVALGSGSDVAKSAAGLVLLDDNFQTITLAIQEGRRILSNIQKTVVYLMSNSLNEVFVVGGSLLFSIPLPLSALQIIWVNLCTGSLPALAFAYDENFDHDTSKKHSLKSIFTTEVKVLAFGIGATSSLLLFIMYYFLIRNGIEVSLARSVFFVCFASYILVVSFSFRSLRKPLFTYPIFSNKKLNQGVLIAFLMLLFTMLLPQMRDVFGLVLLPFVWLWFVLGWLVLNVLLVEGAKYVLNKRHLKSMVKELSQEVKQLENI